MTVQALWARYARIWSADPGVRASELPACLAPDVSYTDPNTSLQGHEALSHYMAGFQANVPPGAAFKITDVRDHHARSLAFWKLVTPDGVTLQSGTSFARHAEDGRLQEITGFFPVD